MAIYIYSFTYTTITDYSAASTVVPLLRVEAIIVGCRNADKVRSRNKVLHCDMYTATGLQQSLLERKLAPCYLIISCLVRCVDRRRFLILYSHTTAIESFRWAGSVLQTVQSEWNTRQTTNVLAIIECVLLFAWVESTTRQQTVCHWTALFKNKSSNILSSSRRACHSCWQRRRFCSMKVLSRSNHSSHLLQSRRHSKSRSSKFSTFIDRQSRVEAKAPTSISKLVGNCNHAERQVRRSLLLRVETRHSNRERRIVFRHE